MRAMPFPEYISTESRNRLNVFYSICQICATSQVLFSYHLDEVFAGTAVNHLSPKLYSPHLIAYLSSICQLNLTHKLHFLTCSHSLFSSHSPVVLPIQIAALLMTMVRKSIISAGAWHYYYTLSLLTNFFVGPIAGYFNPAGTTPCRDRLTRCFPFVPLSPLLLSHHILLYTACISSAHLFEI